MERKFLTEEELRQMTLKQVTQYRIIHNNEVVKATRILQERIGRGNEQTLCCGRYTWKDRGVETSANFSKV